MPKGNKNFNLKKPTLNFRQDQIKLGIKKKKQSQCLSPTYVEASKASVI